MSAGIRWPQSVGERCCKRTTAAWFEMEKMNKQKQTRSNRYSIWQKVLSAKLCIKIALKTSMLPDSVTWPCHVEMNPLGNFQNCSAFWRCAVVHGGQLVADIHVNTNLDYVLLFYRFQR